MYDVIIVGAGPAGSSAARFLIQSGINVLVLDKTHFPRNKPCGGAISPRGWQKYPELSELMEISTNFGVLSYKQPDFSIKFSKEEPIACYVRRIQFDNDLLNLAKHTGAEVKEGVRIKSIKYEINQVIVSTNDGESYSSKYLLGADGVNSFVRKSSMLQQFWNKKTIALIFMNEILLGKEKIEKMFPEGRTSFAHLGYKGPTGYGWVFPKREHINFGFGEVLSNKSASIIYSDYFNFLQYCNKIGVLPNLTDPLPKPLAWQLQMGGPMKHFAAGRVLLVGDAAGFVHPVSGEGILYAIWSAQIATECIKNALNNQQSLEILNKNYETKCWKEFALDLKKMEIVHKIGVKQLSLFFRLAQKYPMLGQSLIGIVEGNLSYSQIKRRIMKRMIVGLFKGNMWKK